MLDIQIKLFLLSVCKFDVVIPERFYYMKLTLFRLLHVTVHHAEIPSEFYFHFKDDIVFECNESRPSGV